MRQFFVVKADQPRESPLYHPYAVRFAWSEEQLENPALQDPEVMRWAVRKGNHDGKGRRPQKGKGRRENDRHHHGDNFRY